MQLLTICSIRSAGVLLILATLLGFMPLDGNSKKPAPAAPKQAKVRAQGDWQRSSIAFKAGDIVHLEGSGSWSIRDGDKSFTTDAGGISGLSGIETHGCPAPLGSLICRVGKQVFFVGKSRDIILRESGLMEFRVNELDSELKDNSGEIEVVVSELEKNTPALLKNVSAVRIVIGKRFEATFEYLDMAEKEEQVRGRVVIEGGLGGKAGPDYADLWREQVKAFLPVRCQLAKDAEILVTRPFHPRDHKERCQWSCVLSGKGPGKEVKDCRAGDTR